MPEALLQYAADSLQEVQTWLLIEHGDVIDDDLATIIQQRAFNAAQRGYQAGLAAKAGADDPQWDATDAAHPAWWRGHDQTSAVFCREVSEILDGKEPAGVSCEPWETLSRRLWALRQEAIAKGSAERPISDRDLDDNELDIAMTAHKEGRDAERELVCKLAIEPSEELVKRLWSAPFGDLTGPRAVNGQPTHNFVRAVLRAFAGHLTAGEGT